MPDTFIPELVFGNWVAGMLSTDTAPAYRTLRGQASGPDAEGWAVFDENPVNLSFESVLLDRQGFNNLGQPSVFSDTVLKTTRVREVWPNQAFFTPNYVALSEYVCAADRFVGRANNSVEISPQPICQWVMPERLVVGSVFHWELIAFHWAARLGVPVAAVHVRATNGVVYTPWQVVNTMSLSTYVEDARPTGVYQGDLNVSSLPDGLCWLEAKVFPHIGVDASVAETAPTQNLRTFSRRYFTKNTVLAASPPLVYVASTGNDTTGVVSTTAATAAASPCLTVQGAINRAVATLPSGLLDGLEIRIVDTVAFGTSPGTGSRNQSSGAITITRAPGTSRSAAIVQQSTSQSFRLGLGGFLNPSLTFAMLVFKDVTIRRTAAGQIGNGGTPALHVQLWNCIIDNGSITGSWGSGGTAISHFGTVWTNVSTTTFGYNANQIQYMLRGVVADIASGYEGGCVVGSTLTRCSAPAFADAQTGAVWYNNAFPNPASANAPINISTASAGQNINGVAIVQNFVEPIHTSSGTPAVRVSSDTAFGNVIHAVIHHNTVLGDGILGRWNICYDDNTTTARTHKFVSMKLNICPQINVKGDVNAANAGITNPELRTGNRALIHGVSCAANFTKRAVNNVPAEAQLYPGLASNIGTSITILNDPLFVADRGTTFTPPSTYTAGIGGSDVNLQAGSPCRAMIAQLLVPFDFAGNPRSGTVNAGIYA